MYRKIKIKSILILFIVLLTLFVFVEMMDRKKGDRTFRNDLVEVSIDDISEIRIFPRVLRGESVILKKDLDKWFVNSGDKKYNADQSLPASMIDQLNYIKPISLAGNKKDQWIQFEVTDSLGTRVQLMQGNEIVADLIIGKFSYQTQKVTSYVRLKDENDIYGVEGFLSMTFNRDLKSFRDQTITEGQKGDWSKFTFTYPGDSSFVLSKSGNNWLVNGMSADSVLVNEFINGIADLNSNAFSQTDPNIMPSHTLLIEGNNMINPIKIEGYYIDDDNFDIESSLNKGTYFSNPEISKKIFVSRAELLKQ